MSRRPPMERDDSGFATLMDPSPVWRVVREARLPWPWTAVPPDHGRALWSRCRGCDSFFRTWREAMDYALCDGDGEWRHG